MSWTSARITPLRLYEAKQALVLWLAGVELALERNVEAEEVMQGEGRGGGTLNSNSNASSCNARGGAGTDLEAVHEAPEVEGL